ncbi:helix-turn-helix transcriptional regulator [Actinoplanes sp. M2I2]|uniref:helix-turn-helix transcriptional regulator n=1 Tax=Actinoplanes sp. M2I2 TaxID=1734444 RepID=UPI0020209AAE|nr:helix-turn-helix transcriptional regulator [Actinoplanes sp. M2I2]
MALTGTPERFDVRARNREESVLVLLRLPLGVAVELARTTTSTLIAVFPSPMTGLPAGTATAVMRRATAFIEDHPERPLTVGDIAAAAGVGIRALQTAFRRDLRITPTTYLRRVRLDRVHQELLAGGPGVTVRETARRWGFTNLGRFAAEYRAAYGRSPGQTLRG